MITRKIIYILIFFFYLCNISNCMSMQNTNNIKIIINNDIILQKNINEILSITRKIYNNKYLQLYYFLNIKNMKDIIKYFVFLQIIKENGFSIPEEDLNDLILNIYSSNNTSEDIIKTQFLDHNINYTKFYKIFQNIIFINILKNKFLSKNIDIYDEEVESLSNQLYLKSKTHKIYDITIFYFIIKKNPLKDKFNHKIFLLNQLISILQKKKLKNNFKKYNEKTFISHFNIKRKFLKNKQKNQLSLDIINYLDNSKKKDIIGPIYLNSQLFLIKINNIFTEDNIDNEKVLLQFIYIKKKNLSKENFNNKIKNIYFNLLQKKITFKKAIQLFSDDVLTNKFGNNKNWMLLKNFSPKFRQIIRKLKINEFSLPIQESDSCFIIQLLDKNNTQNNKFFFKQRAYKIILRENIERESELFIYEYSKNIYIKNINS
ncbi:hypothetical protein GJU01_00790 [Enterobacteriaceae endosymbiont of Donacia vulgaris]|uniref:peptidylprolyl isomerase n=1 Tax=Enterobacteriaceae endosymbiont of Donacia vulgaris TaxID=2675789 RepID=UPI0014492178|nr:peptidylprolyl isomerase [Enterobacteriaceae endosymbiont of Donacia vulgaris]QJC36872.1 hypothetical protein GJU01_00790 [Enterobacteriaceae endosymbiont of Donacia vulgaris]